MTVPKILLLAGSGPEVQHAGEIIRRDACRHYPTGRLCRFSPVAGGGEGRPGVWLGCPLAFAEHPKEHTPWRCRGRLAGPASLARHALIRRRAVPMLVERAAAFGRAQGVELVWAVLNSPTMVYMARHLAARLGVPLVLLVMDPPEHQARNLRMGMMATRELLREFGATLNAAARLATASDAMRDEYRRSYGVQSVVLIHGPDRDTWRPPSSGVMNKGEFVIGAAGSLYAVDTMRALFDALESVDWVVEGRPVRMKLLSAGVSLRAGGPAHVEYLGWRSGAEVVAALSRVDVCYLPYMFGREFDISVRLCFPNKLTPYLAAGKPVFYHGPRDGSPVSTMARYPFGLCCHSLAPEAILAGLRRFIVDPAFYAAAAEAGRVALCDELGMHVFLGRFAQLIGIRPEDLTAGDAC